MKKLSMTLLLAALMIVLAACGTNDKESGRTTASDSENTTQVKLFQLSMSLATSLLKYRKTLKK